MIIIYTLLCKQEYEYLSINTVGEEDDASKYPIEFLNSITLASISHHKLIPKIGIPIMLLRNISPPKLCNGTRLIVKQLLPILLKRVFSLGLVLEKLF